MQKIFITRSIHQKAIDELKKYATINIWNGPKPFPSKEDILLGVKDASVLISLLTDTIDREIMEKNPNLLGIANYAVGYNNIDMEIATNLGIPVTNTPGVLTETTADLTFALIMACARRIPEAHNYTVNGRFKIWGPTLFLGQDVSKGGSGKSKILGIIGFGRIGKAVHKRAVGFDMQVFAYDPQNEEEIKKTDGIEYRELNELLKQSDFITIHVPLTKETHHLISEKELNLMKNSSILINTSRGPVVDEKALFFALKNNKIFSAGLDVYENEPEIFEGLTSLQNVVLLPHIGSASLDTREKMALIAAENAISFLKGQKAPNTVNKEVYDKNEYKARVLRRC